MTSTYVTIPQTFAVGDQLTEATLDQIAANLDFFRLPPSGTYALSTAGANLTTSSTTFVDLTLFTVTLTTQGNPINIFFNARVNSTNARFDILVDNVSVSGDNDALGSVTPASTFGNNGFFRRIAVSAGSHTVKIQWRVTTGTGTLYAAGLGQLYVWEQ